MINKKVKGTTESNDVLAMSEAFFQKYKKPILTTIVVVVLVILGIFAYKSLISGPREEKASTAIAKGQEYFNQEIFEKALKGDGVGYEGFEKIASEYSGTNAGNLANLYAGLCCANLDKWDAAKNYLEKYKPENDAMVSPAAVAALGNVYANLNILDKAVEMLKKAADMADNKAADNTNNTISPIFLLQAGQLLESQGKKQDALDIYKDIKTKYVNSMLVQSSEIDKYIERVSQ